MNTENRTISRIEDAEQRRLLHPMERSRLALAMVAVLPLCVFALTLVMISRGFILVILGGISLVIWFSRQIFEARLKGCAIAVNKDSFPEVHEALNRVRSRLSYDKPVTMYVVQDSDVNATLLRLFGKRLLWINSGLLEAMSGDNGRRELEFIIGRFIGALKAKHLRFHEFMVIIDAFERLWFANLFILPYTRATVLSGDRLGLAACGNFDATMRAMNKLMIGKDLADRLNVDAVARQGKDFQKSIFRILSIIVSPHPHMTDRYLNLLSFIRTAQGKALGLSDSNLPATRIDDDPSVLLPRPDSGPHPKGDIPSEPMHNLPNV